MNLSKQNQYTIDAYEKGYRVVNGDVISPYTGKKRKLRYRENDGNRKKYYRFSVKVEPFVTVGVLVHKLVAYQKYKMDTFKEGIEVRHLDGDSLNNLDDNIVLGSHSDNMLDRPAADREKHSILAAKENRKFTDIEMEEIRSFHNGSYKETMETFDITSKGTLHYILNTKYKTKKM